MDNLSVQEGSQQITGDLEVLGSINNAGLSGIITKVETATGEIQRVATTVESQIGGLADDGVITPAEKATLRDAWNGIASEYPIVRQRAIDAGVEVAAYEAAYEALRVYLYGEPAVLDNMAVTTTTDRNQYTTLVTNYSVEKETIRTGIDNVVNASILNRPTYDEVLNGKEGEGWTIAPEAPVLVGSCMFTSAYLSWSKQENLTGRVTTRVYRALDLAGPWNIIRVEPGQAFADRDLALNGTAEAPTSKDYHYRVTRMVNGLTESPPSNTITLTARPIPAAVIEAGAITAAKIDVDSLFAIQIELLAGGSIYAGYSADGTPPVSGAGFHLSAAGLLQAINAKLLGTLRTGAGASDSARVAIQDQSGILSNTFVGTLNNLVVLQDGVEAGTFRVKISRDVTRYPAGTTGPAGGKVFYTDPSDGYLLEIALSDITNGRFSQPSTIGASGTAVKTGEANTSAIVGSVSDYWGKLGSSFALQAINGQSAITALNSTTIAYMDSTNSTLRVYTWNGSSWSQIGSGLSISGAINIAIAALSSTDIAFIDGVNHNLRTYRWNGSSWSQIGYDTNVYNSYEPAMAALSSTTIALFSDDKLRMFTWDGTWWSQIGSYLSIPTNDVTAIGKLTSVSIAFMDSFNDSLRVYTWNGSSWSQAGSGLSIPGIGCPAIAGLNSTDIAYIDAESVNSRVIRKYRWNGSSWTQIGSGMAVTNCNFAAMAALDSTDIALIDGYNNTLATYRNYSGFAANYADNYSFGGYSDWFLPSKDELNLMYQNRAAIGGFGTGEYWSSSESGATTAYSQNFGTGAQPSSDKAGVKSVRAIRKFYIKDWFQWNKNGGAYSAEQEITANQSYPLGGTSGISVAFTTALGHVTNDYWELEQGSMYGLSIRDAAQAEYVRATSGTLYAKSAGNVTPVNGMIPTVGAGIIESGGDDTNGRYIMYGDGTMECFGVAGGLTMPVGTTAITIGNWPKQFVGYPKPSWLVYPFSHWSFTVPGSNGFSQSSNSLVWSNASTSQIVDVYWRAIGRWKL